VNFPPIFCKVACFLSLNCLLVNGECDMGLVDELRRDWRSLCSPTPVIPKEALPGPWLDEKELGILEKRKAAEAIVPADVQAGIRDHAGKILELEGQLLALGPDVAKVDEKKALMEQMDTERKAMLASAKDKKEGQVRTFLAGVYLDELKHERAKKT